MWFDIKGNPIGIVHIGRVTPASVAYVTKYVVQNSDGFAVMSRGYGIGAHYLTDEMCNWHRQGLFNHAVVHGVKIRLPRFYRDKIFYSEKMRSAIRSQALTERIRLVQRREALYKSTYGDRWQRIKKVCDDLLLSNVKQKLSFTQTF